MAVIGNAPFQGLVSGGEILDASIEGVDLSTSAIAARLGYTPVNPGAAVLTGAATISVTDNTNAALRITQTGSGNALLVEDSTNPDATPFVIDAGGRVLIGATSSIASLSNISPSVQQQGISNDTSSTSITDWQTGSFAGPFITYNKSKSGIVGTRGIVAISDRLGGLYWAGDDGTAFITAASISVAVDGTPGTNDMPGRLVFSTTADGASAPTERMRINSFGNVGIGTGVSQGDSSLTISKNLTGAPDAYGIRGLGTVQTDVTAALTNFQSNPSIVAAAFTLPTLRHYQATQGTFGAGSTVTNQYGFSAESSLVGATNNYGFYSSIPAATGRWNFYANGTASNYFGGGVLVNTTTSIGLTSTTALEVNEGSGRAMTIGRSTANSNGINLNFVKSRAAVYGQRAILLSGDALGELNWWGDDGTQLVSAAQIRAEVDGTPGTNDMPGRLVFRTTADGASTITERMRIDSAGNVGIGTTTPQYKLDNTGVTRLGSAVTAIAPSATDILPTAHTILSGAGGNYLTFGQYPAGQGYAQWIQSSFTNPTTAAYNLVLNPLGGNVGIGTAALNGARLTVNTGSIDTPATSGNMTTGIVVQVAAGSQALNYGNDATGAWYNAAFANNAGVGLAHRWLTGGAERVRITSEGRLGIGTTSPVYSLAVTGANNTGTASFDGNMNGNLPGTDGQGTFVIGTNFSAGSAEVNYFHNNSTFTGTNGGHRFSQRTGTSTYADLFRTSQNLTQFYTANTERMRIDSSGIVGIGTSSPNSTFQATIAGQGLATTRVNIGGAIAGFSDGSTIYLGSDGTNPANWTPSNATYRFGTNRGGCVVAVNPSGYIYEGGSGTGTRTFAVNSNGNVQNSNNSYGSLSDAKLKENITDTTSKLESLLQVKIRNFNLIADPLKTKQIGVVAQELETVFPSMIDEHIDYVFEEYEKEDGTKDTRAIPTGTVTKEVKYSVFVPILIKAIQELKAIVDAQAVEIAALKSV